MRPLLGPCQWSEPLTLSELAEEIKPLKISIEIVLTSNLTVCVHLSLLILRPWTFWLTEALIHQNDLLRFDVHDEILFDHQ